MAEFAIFEKDKKRSLSGSNGAIRAARIRWLCYFAILREERRRVCVCERKREKERQEGP